jgi:hypothetical protein
MPTMAIPPRTPSLNPADPGHAHVPPGDGKPWWTPLREWPPGMRFEDVAPACLRTVDRLRQARPATGSGRMLRVLDANG